MINKKNSFYEKYRPKNFIDFIGQKYIIKSLLFFFKKKKFPSSYIFYGSKGTGKTTLSKLFAKSLNCIRSPMICNYCDSCNVINNNNSPDFKEIDAASNRTVEEITSIFEDYMYRPIFMNYKIYVLDEFHMLSKYSFNSLLNFLENLPSFVKVVFITTEISKIPETILSRCINFKFNKISFLNLKKHIKFVSKNENIKITNRSIFIISNLSNGSLRDCLVILESLSSVFNKIINSKKIYKYYNLINEHISFKIIKCVFFIKKYKFLCLSKKIVYFNHLEILKKILENLNEILVIKEIKNIKGIKINNFNFDFNYVSKNFSFLKKREIYFVRKRIVFEIRNFPDSYFSYHNFLSSILKVIFDYNNFVNESK